MRIPKKARKLVFDNQTWFWLFSKPTSDYVVIWSPTKQKFLIPAWKLSGFCSPRYSDDERWIVRPGDVRKYIQQEVLGTAPKMVKDQNAILGKMYVFRHCAKNYGSAPEAYIEKIEGGEPGFRGAENFLTYLTSGKPMMLIQHWIDQPKKIGYYKILTKDAVVTLKIAWPRTWLGAFMAASSESGSGQL